MQHTTVRANPCSVAVDTRAIQDSELFRRVEEASSLSIERKTEVMNHMPKITGQLRSEDLYRLVPTEQGGVRYILICLEVFTKFVKLHDLRAATDRKCLQKMISTETVLGSTK
jgi:hypothetical protein